MFSHLSRPNELSLEDIQMFADRWNRTLDYNSRGITRSDQVPSGESTNFLSVDGFEELAEKAESGMQSAEDNGYTNLIDAMDSQRTQLVNAFNELPSDGVCSEIRLQITQDVVQTRQGFQATLGLSNQTIDPLTNVDMEVVVLNTNGDDVSNLFGITNASQSGFFVIDSNLALQSQSEGITSWLIVPSSEAALTGPTEYYVAGFLAYTELGIPVEHTLLPTRITVLPQPELSLDYFWQRDVIGDDPHTDEIEPSEIFTLGVQVRNDGVGDARELRIESAQPKIIENEKGLLIDFEIIGTSVNGEPAERTLTALIGDLPGGELAIAEWQLESTLQGLFTEYEASFEHISDFGRPDLSLVKSVQIHELIRPVNAIASGVDDQLTDFLVNDIPDPLDLPDTLYLSDGSIVDINRGSNPVFVSTPSLQNLVVNVTADMPAGWAYLQLDDPSDGNYQLIGIRRADGTILDISNFWQTDRTFIGLGLRPLYENKVHLLDFDSTGSYEFIYSNGDLEGPSVERFSGVNPNPTDRAIGLIDVEFNELVDPSTISPSNVTLLKNGQAVETSSITISAIANPTMRISGLSSLTSDDAVYELQIDLTQVTDFVGNAGGSVASFTWVKGEAAPAVIEILGAPHGLATSIADSLRIRLTESVDIDSLSRAITVFRDGQSTDISSLTLNESSAGLYEVSGLDALNLPDGNYEWLIDATKLTDSDGLAGIGRLLRSWTLDTVAPQISAVFAPPTNPRNIVVQRIDVQFSEAIDIESLGVDDISLTRNDSTDNLIAGDSRVTIEDRGNNVYRIGGINWVQGFIANPQIADFTFRIFGDEITDLAGNPGSGSASTAWTIDLASPLEPSDQSLAIETLPAGADERTPNAVFSGTVIEDNLILVIENNFTGEELFRGPLSDQQFAIPFRLPSEGRNELSGRVIDIAGNTTDFDLPEFYSTSLPPVIVSTTGFEFSVRRSAVSEFTIEFAKPLAEGSFSIEAIGLVHDGAVVPIPGDVSIESFENGTQFTVTGFAEVTSVEGEYSITIDLSKLRSVEGRMGVGSYGKQWTLDRTPPETHVVTTLLESTTRRYLVAIESGDLGTSPSPLSRVVVFTAAATQPLRLIDQLDAETLFTQYEASTDDDHLFFSAGDDLAGNIQTLVLDSSGAFSIQINSDQQSDLPDSVIIAPGTNAEFQGSWVVTEPFVVDGLFHHQLMVNDRMISVETSTPWRNPVVTWDVNHSGDVSALDALRIINRLIELGAEYALSTPETGADHQYYDVNGDGIITAVDALQVINHLNNQNQLAESEFHTLVDEAFKIATTITQSNLPAPEYPQPASRSETPFIPPRDVESQWIPAIPKKSAAPATPRFQLVDDIFAAIGRQTNDEEPVTDNNQPIKLLDVE